MTGAVKLQMLNYLTMIPGILLAFTFHEYAHARVADMLGDKTPRYEGRLTLNPLAHLDLVGTLLIIISGFGWAKPVTVNRRAFKNYYKDDLKVSIAGPLANLMGAILSGFLLGVIVKIAQFSDAGTILGILSKIFKVSIILNVNLFIFNLLPIPGFDGFNVLVDMFPKFFYKYIDKFYKYQYILLFGAVIISPYIISTPAYYITDSILSLVNIIMF